MSSPEERDGVRERLLSLARADGDVVAAAVTGSHATGDGDRWSDVDLSLAVEGERAAVLERWTERLYGEFGALHHWDLPLGATVFRVFLLPGGLEVDIAFAPPAEFGARGAGFRLVFGHAAEGVPPPPPDRDDVVGRAWHHVLHARACIERGRPWQAEYWLGGVRDLVLALACVRLGLPARHARGVDALPAELTRAVEPALVRSLDADELRRALAVVASALAEEIARSDDGLAARLRPVLEEAGGVPQRSEPSAR